MDAWLLAGVIGYAIILVDHRRVSLASPPAGLSEKSRIGLTAPAVPRVMRCAWQAHRSASLRGERLGRCGGAAGAMIRAARRRDSVYARCAQRGHQIEPTRGLSQTCLPWLWTGPGRERPG